MKLIKIITFAMILLIATTFLFACDSGNDNNPSITIKFVGMNNDTSSVVYDESTFVLPTPKEYDEYTFVGWYMDKPCTILFDAKRMSEFVEENVLIIYAKYEKYQYIDDTFDINFYTGNDIYTTITLLKDEKFEMPVDPIFDDYVFVAWYTDKDLSEPFDYAKMVGNGVNSDITLYAKVKAKSANINQYVDNNKIGTTIAEKTSTPTLIKAPYKEGKTFAYWINRETKKIFDLETYMSSKNLEDINILAVYANNSVNVTLKSQDLPINIINVALNEDLILPTLDDNAYYTFSGWALEDTTFDLNSFNNNILREDIELNAIWTNKINYITYQVGDGKEHKTKIDGEAIVDPVTTPNIEGKFFDGWYYSNAGVEMKFDMTTYLEDMNRADITLYPKYIDSTAKVDFYVDDKVINTLYLKSDSELIMPANITKTGYNFVEWQLNGSKFNEKEFKTKLANDTLETYTFNLIAKFDPITTNIIFTIDDTTPPIRKQYKYGEPFTMPEVKEKPGFIFDGWYDSNTKTKFDLEEYNKNPDKDNIFLEARFIPIA